MTTTQHSEITITASAEAIRRVLLTPSEFADWNPAFTSITGPDTAEVGTPYPIRVRPGFNGTLTYSGITPDRIDIDWQIPGLHEKGTWTLTSDGAATVVRHGFSQSGPLAVALRNAFRGVADLRLQRLADRVG
jgi:hypothetical protein